VIVKVPTVADNARLWHPWLRIQRLIRVILGTRWNADEWPIVKAELRNALKERRRLERAGWFNPGFNPGVADEPSGRQPLLKSEGSSTRSKGYG
jgi:hypothetical protein